MQLTWEQAYQIASIFATTLFSFGKLIFLSGLIIPAAIGWFVRR